MQWDAQSRTAGLLFGEITTGTALLNEQNYSPALSMTVIDAHGNTTLLEFAKTF
jgi:hypothetical protein